MALGRDSWQWDVLALACAGWIVGLVIWVAGGSDSPSLAAAIVLLGATVTATIGLAFVPGAPPHTSGRARTVVDGLIVAGSGLFVAWVLGLGDLYANSAGSHRTLVLVVATANLTLASAATVMLTRARPAARPALGLVAGALWAIAAATAAMAYRALGGGFDPAAVLYLGVPAACVLLALAVRRSQHAPPVEEIEPGLPTRASVFVPSAPFAVAILAAAVAGAGGDFGGFLIWCGAAVIVLIVMRQVLALLENISFWRRLEAKVEAQTDELRDRERRFRSLVQNASDVIVVIDDEATVRYLSPSARLVFGYGLPELSDTAEPVSLIPDEDVKRLTAAARKLESRPGLSTSIEFSIRHRDGGLRDVEAILTNLRDDPAVGGFVVNARDITERKDLERQLRHQAFHDPLTELANRALFGDRLEHAIQVRDPDPDSLAVLFLDLDDFKNVNDSLGHQWGDRLLSAVSQRLVDTTRPGDTIARLGGDEFAILLEDIDGPLEAARIAARALEAFEDPFVIGDDGGARKLFVRASIGIATNSGESTTAERLLANADVAMYAAKARGKGRFEHFEHGMHAALVEGLELEQDLRAAVERGEFVLEYQPVLSLASGGIPAVEALVRWDHPERGMIPPCDFIPLAEQTGLIVPIGRWVLEAACGQAARWQRQIPQAKSLTMMVNISVKQLEDAGFIREIEEALRRSFLSPGALVLEVTESVSLEDEGTIARLKGIRGLGVRLGIDDFGTKYSSLRYLKRLPIDVLKIDREFIHDLGPRGSGPALLQAIIAMSESMRLSPIAEGVETSAQEEELRRLGCRLAQGFHFGRPGPPSEIAELLADASSAPLLEVPDPTDWAGRLQRKH